MTDPALAAWNDPNLTGAAFIVSAFCLALLTVIGIPHMVSQRESRPIVLGFIATTAVIVSLTLARTDMLSDGKWFQAAISAHTITDTSAQSAGAKFATAAAPFLGDIDPESYGDIGKMIIHTSRMVVMLNEKLPPLLEQAGPTITRLNSMLERLDTLMTEATPALKEARPVLHELPPLLRNSNALVTDLGPLIRDSKALTAALTPLMSDAEAIMSEVKKRDPGKLLDQSARMMDRVDGTLSSTDMVLQNLQFMDENWLRHFLQVEGVRAYAGVGSPDIPKQSKPVEPPPIRRK